MASCHHTNLVNVSQTLLHWVDSPRAFSNCLYSWSLIMSDTEGTTRVIAGRWKAWEQPGVHQEKKRAYNYLIISY